MNTLNLFIDSYWIWSYWISLSIGKWLLSWPPAGALACPMTHEGSGAALWWPVLAQCRLSLTQVHVALQGTLELADLPLQKGSVELLKQRWESVNATRPGPTLQCSPAPQSPALGKISRSSTVEKVPADSRREDVFKEETLSSPQQIEHFPTTVEELRSHFEALGGKKVNAWAGWTRGGSGVGRRAAGRFSQPHNNPGWAAPATAPVNVL